MAILLEDDARLAEALLPAIPSDPCVVSDLVALRRVLADEEHHDLVVIGPDIDMVAVADLAATERILRPALGVVLIRRRIDTAILKEALRAGVREVVKLDDVAGLTSACRESINVSRLVRGEARAEVAHDGDLGRLITVFSAKGGCGKTTLATNLAAATARLGKRTCLVDLDLAFGDVAITLQLFPEHGIADIAAAGGTVDRKIVSSVVTAHSELLDAVLAPVEPGLAESVSGTLVAALLQTLKQMYDVVVVDTPPSFTDHVLAAFDASDHVALVTTLDVPALKNLKLTMETLELLGYTNDRWRVVLNRADAKVGLALSDVEQALRASVSVQIPSSRAVPAAINRGVTLVHDAPGHPVSTAVRAFAESLFADVRPAPRRRKLGMHRRTAAVAT